MQSRTPIRTPSAHPLAKALAENSDLRPARAALWIAAQEYPGLDVDAWMDRVDCFGADAARREALPENFFARLDALHSFFFDEEGFGGDPSAYDDPEGAYLNRVFETQRGLPVCLSILYMEAARHWGFETEGVSLPGHFIVRVGLGGRSVLVDPFHGGEVLSVEDCRERVRRIGRQDLFHPSQLAGVSRREIVARLLRNLKYIHLGRGDPRRALRAVEWLLILKPGDPCEVRDRGFLMARLGRLGAALTDLEAYLHLAPQAPDARAIRNRTLWLRKRLAETN